MTEGTSAPVNSTASAGTPSGKQGSSAPAKKNRQQPVQKQKHIPHRIQNIRK